MGWKYKTEEERKAARLEQRRVRYYDPEVHRSRIESTKRSRLKRLAENPDINKQEYRKNLDKNPRHNEYSKLNNYGLTLDEFDSMVEKQANLCAICGGPQVDSLNGKLKSLCVDHDPKLPKRFGVRMLLCSKCNRALGLLQDNTKVLENAMAYLEYWNGVYNG